MHIQNMIYSIKVVNEYCCVNTDSICRYKYMYLCIGDAGINISTSR